MKVGKGTVISCRVYYLQFLLCLPPTAIANRREEKWEMHAEEERAFAMIAMVVVQEGRCRVLPAAVTLSCSAHYLSLQESLLWYVFSDDPIY
ncbi:hypothetical protein EDD85DRAFT_804882 [Armillaria nabsnona]|nr:hypothetical protein EDD85DRAFT_804882 [Armillaria nabsnona]